MKSHELGFDYWHTHEFGKGLHAPILPRGARGFKLGRAVRDISGGTVTVWIRPEQDEMGEKQRVVLSPGNYYVLQAICEFHQRGRRTELMSRANRSHVVWSFFRPQAEFNFEQANKYQEVFEQGTKLRLPRRTEGIGVR